MPKEIGQNHCFLLRVALNSPSMLSNETNHLTEEKVEPRVQDFRLYLQNEFLTRCRKNERYTLSAFARFLGMDISTLAKVLKGQRPIRGQAIKKLGMKLGLNPFQIAEFEKVSPRSNAKNKTDETPSNYQQLTLDAFQVISDWYHYAILELIQLPHFKGDVAWIAKTLKITPAEVQIATERLLRLELIEITPEGKWIDQSSGHTTTLGSNFTASAFKNLQRQILEKAIKALDEVPFEKRSQTSLTMAINPDRIPAAKKKIIEFQRELNRFLGEGARTENDEVYHMSLSLYPVSFVQNKEKLKTNSKPKRKSI